MELKNDQKSHEELCSCVCGYYRKQNRDCLPYGATEVTRSVINGVSYDDGYHQDFFIDRKCFIRYSIPIDTRNFYAMLSLGIGPNYVSMKWLVREENESQFSMDSTTEAVVHNLKMLDEYLAGRLT